MIDLRDYQKSGVDEVRAAYREANNVLFVLSTGGGKTVVFCYISSAAASKGNRVLIVAHRREIIEQISAALDQFGVRHGVIAPGYTMTSDMVQVGMVQTVAKRIDKIRRPDILVIDEAHHSVAGQWRKLADAFSGCKMLGVTATPERLDGKGLGDIYQKMVCGPSMAELINLGYLAPYTYLAPPAKADLSGVKTRMGDFVVGDVAKIMDKATITGDAVEHYRDHLDGRPAIAFCVTVEHAEHVAERFQAAGYRAASVDGKMDKTERRDRIMGLGSGKYNVITSCELISEGVDVPVCAGAILLRPTKSLTMFLQQVGRVLRPQPGKTAVILDHVGNVERHGLPDTERDWKLDGRKKQPGSAPVRQCKLCYQVFDIAKTRSSDWRCPDEAGDDCPLNQEAAGVRPLPEGVDGKLTQITTDPTKKKRRKADDIEPFPAWAQGRDIRKPTPLATLLALATTREQVEEIRIIRGYHHRWTDRAWTETTKTKQAA